MVLFCIKARMRISDHERFVQDWPLARDPIPIALLTIGYLSMIFFGQEIMKNRKEFELRKFMMVYNCFLVIFSTFISLKTAHSVFSYKNYFSLHYKQRLRIEDGPGYQMVLVHYYYLISKIVEFTDTVLLCAYI
ncbi:hypothetical protein MXB_2764 [Myxobolus squamalis]|nr:hypothetical protein MXB_2764 [Myxobolus squamalis]